MKLDQSLSGLKIQINSKARTDVNAFLSRWQAQEIAIFGHLNLALENFCRAF
jgi:hypothetical protein